MIIKEKILSSIAPVIKNSSWVKINETKIHLLAKKLEKELVPEWDNEMQFLGNPEETIYYYFFLDSTNFCFWNLPGKERWQIKKDGKWFHGYYAYSLAIKQAFLADKKLFDASYLSQISFEDFSRIFEGRGELLLLKERHEITKENFGILCAKYGGKILNLVSAADNDVNKIVELIIQDFPSFRDYSEFNGEKVYFLKRAQLFASDINYALSAKGAGYFKNMGDLTIFADYKLPQSLESEGILVYDDNLKNKIVNYEIIEKDSQEEIEIRANTIYACEKLLAELNKLGRNLTSNNLDWMLWVLAKKKEFPLPYHRTITTNY